MRKHPADKLRKVKSVIFTAFSKKNFFARFHISKFVLEKGGVPINPFMTFDWYLANMVDWDLVREANNNLILKADELWVFGEISDGVAAEIRLAEKLKKPIGYFSLEHLPQKILEISKHKVKLEI